MQTYHEALDSQIAQRNRLKHASSQLAAEHRSGSGGGVWS